MIHLQERRRHDLAGRIARATFPIRYSYGEFLDGFPCNIVGHHWVEVPELLRRSKRSDGRKMRFKCSRCFLTGGFTNR